MEQLTIQPYVSATDAPAVSRLWNGAFAKYRIAKDHLTVLLNQSNGHHFVLYEQDTLVGCCVSYVPYGHPSSPDKPNDEPSGTGFLTCIIILPAYQHRNHGTKLLQHTLTHLWKQLRVKEIVIGSIFPRFWSGIPTDLSPKLPAFFSKSGFKKTTMARDLYQSLAGFDSSPYQYLLDRVHSAGFTFRPLNPSEFPECISAQEENFSWAAGYRALHEEGLDHEVFAAFDANGKQAGWCLALSPGTSQVWGGFAFLPIVGGKDGVSGEGQAGLICAVGTRREMRGKGIGLAMLVKALENMKSREGAIEGCFVDWVLAKLWGWYQKTGFEVWQDYVGMKIENPN